MSLALLDDRSVRANGVVEHTAPFPRAVAVAVWHSLFWLVAGNAVGLLIAVLLLFPGWNTILGEWSYGRWIPVHMNLQLYGWCSLPLVAFLFRLYGADRVPSDIWCRPVLWTWSSALGFGALTWLNGHSSGKLFLDWTGYSRVLFPLAQMALWCLLALSLARQWHAPSNSSPRIRMAKIAGLALLFAVPVLLYIASSPHLYTPINPDTGGPTGASQLESTLVIVAVLLLLPFGLASRDPQPHRWVAVSWAMLAFEAVACLALGRGDTSHRLPIQWISLGSLLIWIPLVPLYYGGFRWQPNTRRWRMAFFCWWSILVATGWSLFLPGVLDLFKFTDGLVAHSLLAMAGFASSLLILVLVQLLGEHGWILNATVSYYVWHGSVLAYVAIMFVAGWQEGSNPAFAMVPGALRNATYLLRLMLGVLMLASSAKWLFDASKLLRKHGTLAPAI